MYFNIWYRGRIHRTFWFIELLPLDNIPPVNLGNSGLFYIVFYRCISVPLTKQYIFFQLIYMVYLCQASLPTKLSVFCDIWRLCLIFQVCQQLGIVEVDYFGLQYAGAKGEQLWINVRNRISRQLCGTAPYRLRLRVKFFVEPQYLLQETTR